MHFCVTKGLVTCLQVSIVSQEPVLFAESIMHNIAFGMPGGSGSVSLAMVRLSYISSVALALLPCSHVASFMCPNYLVAPATCHSKVVGCALHSWLPALEYGALGSFSVGLCSSKAVNLSSSCVVVPFPRTL